MRTPFYLEQNASNLNLIKINDTYKVCYTSLTDGKTYFIGEKDETLVDEALLSFGTLPLKRFIDTHVEAEIKILRRLKSANLSADAVLNAWSLYIEGKVFLNSRSITREEIIVFEQNLNKHQRYLIASEDDKITIARDSFEDTKSGSSVSY